MTTEHVKMLRRWMAEHQLAAYIVPTLDPHNSEYLPDRWKAREWLTGFTGSAGLAVVTAEEAALWTDSRYFLQAEEQLAGTPFCLMRDGEAGVPAPGEWLKACLAADATVGYCGELMSGELLATFKNEAGCRLRDVGQDPFDVLWTGRPELPKQQVMLQPLSAAGVSAEDKLAMVREWMKRQDGQMKAYFINDLSEIAWMLNLRGADIDYNPFFVSYLLVAQDRVLLFVDADKISAEVRDYLESLRVEVCGYNDWKEVLKAWGGNGGRLGMPNSMNSQVVDTVMGWLMDCELVASPVPLLRAVKNPVEQQGFRTAMEQDGVAMVQFLRWLDEAVVQGGVTEMLVDKKLTALRAARPGYTQLSFSTIAAYAAHGAIVHYEAEPDTDAELAPKGLLLLDSGAHYLSGTTDITRTIALGELTEEERQVYTLVLKGHIALSRMRFPEGTTGLQLDTAARYALWQEGYDFGHGTGHGVGSRLGVHEDPHQIRKNLRACTVVPFQAGMVVTNEPGVYVPGRFGVRIENVLLVKESRQTDFGKFLDFETLTLCPYDLRPVNLSMLVPEEKQWINDYHAEVRRRLMPMLDDVADRQWLEAATREI